MTEEMQKRRIRRRWWIALGVPALVLAAVIVPPMVSVNRYKSRIADLVSESLGRPVRLSGVELRLLPWPSFVLSNLVVEEDPAYGAEPVLHAESVTADIRLLALWRGRLEISRISVDNASLNLVRMPGGRWNLDPLFRTAAAKAGAATSQESQKRRALPLPYLEATESRINFKNGAEKLPFSIVDADLSFWEDSPGDWHLRLRGEPARTDVSLFQEDTGVVRLDASLHSAPALRDMPLHVDMEWSQAQLGQLARLLIGSDPGWRGNLTADLHLDGTPETAHVTARLQAAGVHRAEFAPAEPLDFDANCAFVYHYSIRGVQNVVCNSPLGNGRVRFTGDLPASDGQPDFTVALDRMPVAAILGFLRTIRSGIDPDLNASGSITGQISYYAPTSKATAQSPHLPPTRRRSSAKKFSPAPLTGSFVVHGFQLSGGALNNPIQTRHPVVLEAEAGTAGQPAALTGTAEIGPGSSSPLTLNPRLTLHGYELVIRGQTSLANAVQLAKLAGFADVNELNALSSGPITVALDAQGPWLPPQPTELAPPQSAASIPALTASQPDPTSSSNSSADTLNGTITIRDAKWKPDYLARSVAIAQATLHLDGTNAVWDPIEFSYGPIRATARLKVPASCSSDQSCPAHFDLQFGNLNAAEVQSAILGAQPHTSLLDDLIDRLHLSSAPAWPPLDGTVTAASLKLGPVVLQDPKITIGIGSTGAKITSVDARTLGGVLQASGSLTRPDTDEGRPGYALNARFSGLSATAVGQLLGMRFAGGPLDAEGKIDLSGVTANELATSAKGTLHFEWRHGRIAAQTPLPAAESDSTETRVKAEKIPTQLGRFSSLAGNAEIGDGAITLHQCEVVNGAWRRPIEAKITMSEPLRVTFAEPQAAKVAAGHATRISH